MAPELRHSRLVVPPLLVPKLLARKWNILSLCGAAAAALVVAFPLAQGIGAVSYNAVPTQQVNRGAKGDLLMTPHTASRKVPLQRVKDPARPVRDQSDKRMLMDGYEPAFSPVTVPSMAHIAGRCVG